MSQSRQYTPESLAEAAVQCGSIDEVIAFFGTAPYERLGRYLMSRFDHYGIDVSHFSPSGKRPRPAEADIRQAVAESVSIAETLRRLGRPDNGCQRALLRRWTAEDGVSTAHFLGQAHQRGKPGPTLVKAARALPSNAPDAARARSGAGDP